MTPKIILGDCIIALVAGISAAAASGLLTPV